MAHTDSVAPINHQLQDIVANIPSPAATRKRRRSFQWITDNHCKFVNALNRSGGIDAAKPCQILELMKNVPGLTREILASHLQKYRAFKNKKVHKRVNKFAKMEELMVLQHQLNPAPLSNNSQHASNIVQGGSNFVPDCPLQPYSAQEGDQEEHIFGALSPLQESYPMPPSAYPSNQESYVLQPQFVHTPTQPTLTQLDYGASIPHQEIQNMCFPTHQLNYDEFVQSLFASNSNQEIDGNLSFPTHQLDYDEIVESPFASSPTNIW